jgi:hypothetical protein
MAVDTLTTFRAVQRVLADVSGMKLVHGVTPPASGTAAHANLRPATDELVDSPSIVLGSGPIEVTPGPQTRLTWTMQGAVWRVRDGGGGIVEAYDGLIGDIGALVVAVQARGKAYSVDASLQSLSIASVAAIDGAEWPAGSNRWFLVAPFELQVVADYDTPITPA